MYNSGGFRLEYLSLPLDVCVRSEWNPSLRQTVRIEAVNDLTITLRDPQPVVLSETAFLGSAIPPIDLSAIPPGEPITLSLAATNGETPPATASETFIRQQETVMRFTLDSPPVAAMAVLGTSECSSPQGAFLTLDGSSSSDADSTPGTADDIALMEWYEDLGLPGEARLGDGASLSLTLAIGSHRISLRVVDRAGALALDSRTVVVSDSTPPSLAIPADRTAECTGPAGAAVDPGEATASDLCCPGPLSVVNDAPPIFSLDETTVTWTARDCHGNTATGSQRIRVVDTVPPQLVIGLMPGALWPPNHRLVDMEVSALATDACGPTSVVLASVTSDEPDDAIGIGDGNTTGDVEGAAPGTEDFVFRVRAERDGGGDGRHYDVTYAAEDGSGNTTRTMMSVLVPLSMAGGLDPVRITVFETTPGTVLEWTAVDGAGRYNVVRGAVHSLRESEAGIDLGELACVEAYSDDTNTLGHEDNQEPPPREAFFYLVEYEDTQWSSFGSESATKARLAGHGSCR
jgi:hypothetical protein